MSTVTRVTATPVVSKRTRLIEAFRNGESMSAKQIGARFSIGNPTATISDLRLRGGFAIYGNPSTNSKGVTSTKYRLGTPARATVAAGYRALASEGKDAFGR